MHFPGNNYEPLFWDIGHEASIRKNLHRIATSMTALRTSTAWIYPRLLPHSPEARIAPLFSQSGPFSYAATRPTEAVLKEIQSFSKRIHKSITLKVFELQAYQISRKSKDTHLIRIICLLELKQKLKHAIILILCIFSDDYFYREICILVHELYIFSHLESTRILHRMD